MNIDYLQVYFVKALGVSLPVWKILSDVLLDPTFLLQSMIQMTRLSGFEELQNFLEMGYIIRRFNTTENGFVIVDEMVDYDEGGIVEWTDETWSMEDGKFMHSNLQVPFSEWMSSFEEKNNKMRIYEGYDPL